MRRILFTLLLALPASAADWYVDAVNGSDSNTGATSDDAWRTITHALAGIPTDGLQRIHVFRGTNDAAHGEVFPFELRPLVQLLGADPAHPPVIAGTPADSH